MKSLRIFLVAVAILGYAALVAYSCIASVTAVKEPSISEPLIYVANALCGLVGGIVAVAFGVELPRQFYEGKSRYNRKMNALGSYIVNWKLSVKENNTDLKELFGIIYAWVYFIVGIAAIVIWVADDAPHVIVKNISTITLGLLIVVVKNYMDGD